MESNWVITDMRRVFDGEFKPGVIAKKNTGRHSDCFVYFVYGRAEYRFDGYSFTASPQNFIYLAKDSLYEICVLEKSRFICIDFDFSDVAFLRKSAAFVSNSQALKSRFQNTLHIWNTKQPHAFPQAFSHTYSLYVEAVKAEKRLYVKKNRTASEMVSYICQHYTEHDFTVTKLAERFEMSETHIRRLFEQSVHTSPLRYIHALRLDKAKNMLLVSNYSIAEIALSVGFDDPYYFSRFFKRETGMSPSEYRK